ncbi:MerR family transcriptional regulator [Streptomyces bohaiensis]|uniref:helix-turn-helix domain-containing protein n=1 Tax=Streptomyces bohaiensis TaxID=1431344 RepID=UPI003B7880C6
MALTWSTRRLADLAGTTSKAIRHYHRLGLLAEPARASNGYKRYGTPHLVRLLQIRRLRDLGMPLARIAEAGGPGDGFAEAVRALDADLAVAIERQQAIRAELAELLRHEAPVDVPAGFEEVASSLTEADRAAITVSSHLFGETASRELREMTVTHRQLDAEFDALSADADEATVRELAARLAPVIRDLREIYPAAGDIGSFALGDKATAIAVMKQTVTDHYTGGQIAVLREVNRILAGHQGPDEPGARPAGSDTEGPLAQER